MDATAALQEDRFTWANKSINTIYYVLMPIIFASIGGLFVYLMDTKSDIADFNREVGELKTTVELMNERLDRMDERFDRMDERFDRMDEKIDRIIEIVSKK